LLVAEKELNYYPEDIVEEVVEDKKKNTKKRSIKKKKKSNALLKLVCISAVAIGMAICLFILYRYANITKAGLEVNKLEIQRNELEGVKSGLLAELEEVKSSEKIREDAMYKLGMSYPKENQIVYISINDSNDDIKTTTDDKNTTKGMDKMFSLFSSLF